MASKKVLVFLLVTLLLLVEIQRTAAEFNDELFKAFVGEYNLQFTKLSCRLVVHTLRVPIWLCIQAKVFGSSFLPKYTVVKNNVLLEFCYNLVKRGCCSDIQLLD